jgi:hypothetical protein
MAGNTCQPNNTYKPIKKVRPPHQMGYHISKKIFFEANPHNTQWGAAQR